MEKNIKQQVKENFQTMEFTAAMEANKELKAEYIRVCGQRSWISLANAYYRKAKQQEQKIEEQPAIEELITNEQPINETNNQPEVEQPTETSETMKQFEDLKSKHPDAIFLFRRGDFYETYKEDAKVASDILGITLTKHKDGYQMAGFPHHALDTYLPKLVRAGKRIAICDQLEDPKLTKKLVKRGITEMVTPGIAEQEETVEEPKQEEPVKAEEFKFAIDQCFNLEEIQKLVESGQSILNQFCVIHEFFKRMSDTETQRYTCMFVKSDGEGWKLYDEGSAAAKAAGFKSYRKLGYFDQSNDGFPVGEEYSQITVMRIKKAMEKFVLGRTGLTQVTAAHSIA